MIAFRLKYSVILGCLCALMITPDLSPVKTSKQKSIVKLSVPITPMTAKPEQEKDIYQWLRTYAEVISIMEKKSFRNVDFAKFMQGSLKAAASEIDAHSAFLNKESYSAAMESTSGEFSGIGVSIMTKAPEDDALVIIDVVPSGPAEKAGLKGGDKIVEVGGKKLKGLSADEVVSMLKDKVGTIINLKVLRNKKPLEFSVTRDIIKDQNSLCYFFKPQNVYYLSLKMFTENAADQVKTLLEKANKGQCKGLVLDLRRNPGGALLSAIEMAGLFLKKKSLVTVTKERGGKVVDQYFTARDPILASNTPVFILIDNFTASAAEILAGSLRYHAADDEKTNTKRPLMVFLVGTATFGKGSVQEVMPISNGCALKLTTLLYFLPGDITIQATGIEPDFIIKPKMIPSDELKWVQDMYGKESSLKHHITGNEAKGIPEPKDEAGKKKATVKTDEKDDKDPKKFEERQQEAIGHDVQVQAAVNMINLLNLARTSNPKAVATRSGALTFLKQQYLTDDKIEIEKIT